MGSQGGGQQGQFQSITRQSSLYSLTLDEVQTHLGDLGKPLSSMNLDELLKNVWSAESNQGGLLDIAADPMENQIASGLQHENSVAVSHSLSKKTVDEVWRDIQQGQRKNNQERKAHERQPTLGEMTLEDFLVKAGVVAEGPDKQNTGGGLNGLELSQDMCCTGTLMHVDPVTASQNSLQQGQWLRYNYQQQAHPQQQIVVNAYLSSAQVPQPLTIAPGPLMDLSYSDTQMNISSPIMSTLSDTTPGRKRIAGDMTDRIVERRQKRMIKNRESAARSRARKQAYTNELESKVSRLEEENERLRKQKMEFSPCSYLTEEVMVMNAIMEVFLHCCYPCIIVKGQPVAVQASFWTAPCFQEVVWALLWKCVCSRGRRSHRRLQA